MQARAQTSTAPRFDPRLIDAATRRAHALRNEAIDEALRQLGHWLRRRLTGRAPAVIHQEQPCHS